MNCIEYLSRSDKFVIGGRKLQIFDNRSAVVEIKNFNHEITPIKVMFNSYFQAFVVLTKQDLRMIDSLHGKII